MEGEDAGRQAMKRAASDGDGPRSVAGSDDGSGSAARAGVEPPREGDAAGLAPKRARQDDARAADAHATIETENGAVQMLMASALDISTHFRITRMIREAKRLVPGSWRSMFCRFRSLKSKASGTSRGKFVAMFTAQLRQLNAFYLFRLHEVRMQLTRMCAALPLQENTGCDLAALLAARNEVLKLRMFSMVNTRALLRACQLRLSVAHDAFDFVVACTRAVLVSPLASVAYSSSAFALLKTLLQNCSSSDPERQESELACFDSDAAFKSDTPSILSILNAKNIPSRKRKRENGKGKSSAAAPEACAPCSEKSSTCGSSSSSGSVSSSCSSRSRSSDSDTSRSTCGLRINSSKQRYYRLVPVEVQPQSPEACNRELYQHGRSHVRDQSAGVVGLSPEGAAGVNSMGHRDSFASDRGSDQGTRQMPSRTLQRATMNLTAIPFLVQAPHLVHGLQVLSAMLGLTEYISMSATILDWIKHCVGLVTIDADLSLMIQRALQEQQTRSGETAQEEIMRAWCIYPANAPPIVSNQTLHASSADRMQALAVAKPCCVIQLLVISASQSRQYVLRPEPGYIVRILSGKCVIRQFASTKETSLERLVMHNMATFSVNTRHRSEVFSFKGLERHFILDAVELSVALVIGFGSSLLSDQSHNRVFGLVEQPDDLVLFTPSARATPAPSSTTCDPNV
ncbi:hypothetical protein FVE85_8834 [Porphyridium purpureum]|uniref:Uncharacterized protein n=1 Tax=Porphyridium purpureum TaxID=35688 RepID=A0A5J4YPM3_PORPP|nr:hypothetical protein FVE85_8834 [Porphyridium purpureum]|eukprot:POR8866..scf296_7